MSQIQVPFSPRGRGAGGVAGAGWLVGGGGGVGGVFTVVAVTTFLAFKMSTGIVTRRATTPTSSAITMDRRMIRRIIRMTRTRGLSSRDVRRNLGAGFVRNNTNFVSLMMFYLVFNLTLTVRHVVCLGLSSMGAGGLLTSVSTT